MQNPAAKGAGQLKLWHQSVIPLKEALEAVTPVQRRETAAVPVRDEIPDRLFFKKLGGSSQLLDAEHGGVRLG